MLACMASQSVSPREMLSVVTELPTKLQVPVDGEWAPSIINADEF